MKAFLIKNKFNAILFISIICISVIAISVECFGNSYMDTEWHWALAVIGCGIIIFLWTLTEPKGCLHGKTPEQVNIFFETLAAFALTDPVVFREQYVDMQLWEKRKFENWLKNDKQNRIAVLQSLNIIDKLMDY